MRKRYSLWQTKMRIFEINISKLKHIIRSNSIRLLICCSRTKIVCSSLTLFYITAVKHARMQWKLFETSLLLRRLKFITVILHMRKQIWLKILLFAVLLLFKRLLCKELVHGVYVRGYIKKKFANWQEKPIWKL